MEQKKPEYEVGEVLYKVHRSNITPITIKKINAYPNHFVYVADNNVHYLSRTLIRSCFKTEEEAQKELLKNTLIKEKRELLKEYEKELNTKYGLEGHQIVK